MTTKRSTTRRHQTAEAAAYRDARAEESCGSSPVLTNAEAARWLRLDDDYDDIGDAIKALCRLVRERGLRVLRCGKSYKFTLAELERFTREEVEAFQPTERPNGSKETKRRWAEGAFSDHPSGGNGH